MEYEVYGIALLPIIIGLLEVVKLFKVPSKFIPIISLVLGILLGVVFVSPNEIGKGILIGINMGLAAVGLHSGVKNIVSKKKIEDPEDPEDPEE